MNLITHLFQEYIEDFRQENTLVGLNSVRIKELLQLSYYLGLNVIHNQLIDLVWLADVDPYPLRGSITNIKTPKTHQSPEEFAFSEKQKLLNSISIDPSKLASLFPACTQEGIRDSYAMEAATNPTLQLVLQEDYEKAVASCLTTPYGINEQLLEHVICYLHVVRKHDLAMEFTKAHVTKAWSYSHLQMVEIIERSRYQDPETITQAFHQCYDGHDLIPDKVLFILGISGIEPYYGYPHNEEWEFH